MSKLMTLAEARDALDYFAGIKPVRRTKAEDDLVLASRTILALYERVKANGTECLNPMPQLERPFRFNGYNKPTPVASCGKCSGCLNAAVVRQMEGK